jgi:phage terminase Nu1 subunit (DNA packaging protein)
VKKENESATKMAEAIATMRESGLNVTDETQKGGSIGITGVHRREECTELAKPTKDAQAIAKLRASGPGVKTAAATMAWRRDIIGGVDRPEEIRFDWPR